MASLLRQIVAGPRLRHPEAGLDLCYVTENMTSGPSSNYPQRAYRNPTDALVKFLDYKHGENWAVWEFRAEGTGYPDSEVYGRVRHYPWPDHHPPPFALVPNIMASMRNWLKDEKPKGSNYLHNKNVVVVHCKAGKGRSGTIACSYLISEEGWKVEDALARFTEKRMRAGFGDGVSIPSQLRWVGYVDEWSKTGKNYIERPVEIVEIHVWGLRDGAKVSIEGYVEEGRKIQVFHTFSKHERNIVDPKTLSEGRIQGNAGFNNGGFASTSTENSKGEVLTPVTNGSVIEELKPDKEERAVVLRPSKQVIIPSSDVCIDVEKRNKAKYGWTMITAVAHVWFNVYFEGRPRQSKKPSECKSVTTQNNDSGVFEINWDAMDGLKGSSRKGTRALDRIAVIWKAFGDESDGKVRHIPEPAPGESVPQSEPADWSGRDSKQTIADQTLGLHVGPPATVSTSLSRASSVKVRNVAQKLGKSKTATTSEESLQAVKTNVETRSNN